MYAIVRYGALIDRHPREVLAGDVAQRSPVWSDNSFIASGEKVEPSNDRVNQLHDRWWQYTHFVLHKLDTNNKTINYT